MSSSYKIKQKTPFESLKFCYGTISNDEWLMLVERIFFLIGASFRFKRPIDISIDEVLAKKPESYSIIHKVVIDYEEKLQAKSVGLENEEKCHLKLIKIIAAAISFEVVRESRKHKKSNLEKYKIPFEDCEQLYAKFVSLSFEAREAMESMYIYMRANHHKPSLFVLEETDSSYREFIEHVAVEDEKMRKWLQQEEATLKELIWDKKKELEAFSRELEKMKEEVRYWEKRPCECAREGTKTKKGNFSTKKILCNRCYKKNSFLYDLKQFEEKELGNKVISKIPKGDALSYAFFYNIPPDILGVMKVFYHLQGSVPANNHVSKFKNIFTVQYG